MTSLSLRAGSRTGNVHNHVSPDIPVPAPAGPNTDILPGKQDSPDRQNSPRPNNLYLHCPTSHGRFPSCCPYFLPVPQTRMFLAHTVKPDEKTKSETERNKTQKQEERYSSMNREAISAYFPTERTRPPRRTNRNIFSSTRFHI